ncbi:MAG: D-alanyl-D-alanine carboxypeptidase [Gracilibacter sp. BRH_c7a]|nr:MAG: D-alanyl-D-alanine carboxypeptidase [Gracilibacter sp. BRH_c7a]
MRGRLLSLFIITIFTITLITGCAQVTSPSNQPEPKPSQLSPDLVDSTPYLESFLVKRGAAVQEALNYSDITSITVLVNKQNHLSDDYVPPDLVEPNIPFTFAEKAEKRLLRQEAASHLEELFTVAQENDIILYGVSGYRSYQTQEYLFQYFVQRDGSEEKANQISARPGESEHQTGLAMDVTSESVNFGLIESFGDTKEYEWLKDNAHLFGFVVRYPQGKEHITEYTYEPWHLRYVGQELALKLYENNMSYEEYLFFRI